MKKTLETSIIVNDPYDARLVLLDICRVERCVCLAYQTYQFIHSGHAVLFSTRLPLLCLWSVLPVSRLFQLIAQSVIFYFPFSFSKILLVSSLNGIL